MFRARQTWPAGLVCLALIAVWGPTASAQDIQLGGNAYTYIEQALNDLGQPYTDAGVVWVPPMSGEILIMGRDGDLTAEVDYQAHLDAGYHVLMIGGSNYDGYYTWIQNYVDISAWRTWHQSSDCSPDWTKGAAHPITQYLHAATTAGSLAVPAVRKDFKKTIIE